MQSKLLPILFLSLCLLSCSPESKNTQKDQALASPQPNIIYIMADDLGYGDITSYGQDKIRTPNLDRLASEGMKFTQHYSGSTVCAPSRCSLMTGKHTGHTVVRGNREIKPEGQFPMPKSTVTLAEMLKEAGYSTAAFGKWGLGYPGSEGDPTFQGFDVFFGYNCQRKAHFYYPEYLWRNRQKFNIPENKDGAEGVYSADLISDQALNYLRGRKNAMAAGDEKPFFLYLPVTIPHAEMKVPESSLAEYKGKFPDTPYPGAHYGAQSHPHAAFAAMVTHMDSLIGDVLNTLDQLDMAENTIIMFTSDNGPHHEGGHDPEFFDSNGPWRGYKRDLYEGGIRVPMIVRWPDHIQAGSKTAHISSFWDVMPTLADAASTKAPSDIDGISFLPALLGKAQEQDEHDYLYWEFHEQGGKQAVLQHPWKAIRLDVAKQAEGSVELYNLEQDPGETQNIAAENPEKLTELLQLMDEAHVPAQEWPLSLAEREARQVQ